MKISESNSNSVFTQREVIVLDLPISENQAIEHPENVMLKIGDQTIDVGSLCYSHRSPKGRAGAKPKLVNEMSLVPSRTVAIEKLIRFASLRLVGQRRMTVITMLDAFRTFTDVADQSGLKDIFDCGKNSELAFAVFANFIYDRYRRGDLGGLRAQSLQVHVLKWFKSLTGNDHFASEVRVIVLSKNHIKEETLPAGQNEFSHLLAMSQMIFSGLTDFVLNNEKFPFKLNLPNSLEWPTGNHLWVFPTLVWYMVPESWGMVRKDLYRPGWAYDYENGTIKTWEEIWQSYGGKDKAAKKHRAKFSLENSIKLIEAANANSMHHRRLHLAKLAFKAFTFLFFANTGVNPSVLSEIETEEDIDASVVNQSYRAIKYRAKGLVITVRVPVSFMPDLRKYMSLRKYILNGYKTSLLFFRFNKFNHSPANLKPMNGAPLAEFFITLRDIDPRISPINPRKIRATLNDWYLRNHEVPVVAKIMGHSEETENRKYGRGSPVNHQQEMTTFLEGMASVAKSQKISNSRHSFKDYKSLEQGGSCRAFGNPQGMFDNPSVQPDCRNNCWYCSNRQLVTDEIDVRKIASAIFVMEQLIQTPELEESLRPFILKCESDLELIGKTGNCIPMVERVKSEVFNKGRLTPFWAGKYNQFLELGAIL